MRRTVRVVYLQCSRSRVYLHSLTLSKRLPIELDLHFWPEISKRGTFFGRGQYQTVSQLAFILRRKKKKTILFLNHERFISTILMDVLLICYELLVLF